MLAVKAWGSCGRLSLFVGGDDNRGEGSEGMVLMVDFNPLAVYFRPIADVWQLV